MTQLGSHLSQSLFNQVDFNLMIFLVIGRRKMCRNPFLSQVDFNALAMKKYGYKDYMVVIPFQIRSISTVLSKVIDHVETIGS